MATTPWYRCSPRACPGPEPGARRSPLDYGPRLSPGRLYGRDDRPFAGPDPPAAIFYYSRSRNGEHPVRHLAGYAGYDGILQADAYAGFGDLYGRPAQTRADHRGGVLGSWPAPFLRDGRDYTLITTAKLNGIRPQAWLADMLAGIAEHPASPLYELLPWHRKTLSDQAAVA